MKLVTGARGSPGASQVSRQRGVLRRKCACGNHTPTGGTCTQCAKDKESDRATVRSRLMQPKLIIGASTDPLEYEADRAADRIAGATSPAASCTDAPLVQRRATLEASTSAGEPGSEAPASIDRALAGGGRPLDHLLRD